VQSIKFHNDRITLMSCKYD